MVRGFRQPVRVLLATCCLLSLAVATVASATGVAPADLSDVRAYAVAHGLVPQTAIVAAPAASTTPTPQLPCRSGALSERRQGRVPLADYESGRADLGYQCNAELVGHYGVSGGYQVHRYVDDAGRECAFYDSSLFAGEDVYKDQSSGTYVLDMTDPAAPVRTAALRTPAMHSPHESLRLHAGRGLLVAGMGGPATQVGFVDIYDVSHDCRHPQLRSSLPLGVLGHEGGLSPDGLTYWVATTATGGITAIDITDPSSPRIVWRSAQWATHGLSLSADGRRAYLADLGTAPPQRLVQGGGGLRILDVSQVQDRVPNPTVREVSYLTWPEATIAQGTIPVTIRGRPYLVQFDEFDTNLLTYSADENVGAARLIDISDETAPRVVSNLRLAVHERDARADDQKDDPGAQIGSQGYAGHYCSVPQQVEPGIVACTMILSGLRVFDIRNPERPREVAYFNRPRTSAPDPTERGAYAMAAPAFAPDRREVWYADVNTGFWSVRLDERAWPREGSPVPGD